LLVRNTHLLTPSCVCRSASLAQINAMLREQLDQATSANQSLTTDVQRLTTEWQRAREELEVKEVEWREEEQVKEQPCSCNFCSKVQSKFSVFVE